MTKIQPDHFRQVLGQYPTGVVLVTAFDPTGSPLGMTVGSFTSVSLDPPLVAFLPSTSSSSWAALRAASNTFCVNVMPAEQEEACRSVASRKCDKFRDIELRTSPGGNPIVEEAVAWIDCTIEEIHPGGDHEIVVGRVTDLGVESAAYPLLFFRGGYGSFRPLSLMSGDAALVEQLRLVDLARPQMERLAARFDTEVSASALVHDELVVVASAGRNDLTVVPTRVGERVPFAPPFAAVFAAFGGEHIRDKWLGKATWAAAAEREELALVPDRVRRQGFAIGFGHEPVARVELLGTRWRDGDPDVSTKEIVEAAMSLAPAFNPASYNKDGDHELRTLSAPVFTPDGQLAFAINLWGPLHPVSGRQIEAYSRALIETARGIDLEPSATSLPA